MNEYIFKGQLEVYCGPMNSGKSKFILARADTLDYVKGIEMRFFKPKVDKRDKGITSRFANTSRDCILIDENKPENILNHANGKSEIIFIDEVQFFSDKISQVIKSLMQDQKHIIASGLDMDFRGEPFGPMSTLLPMASQVHKLTGVCQYEDCSRPATLTQRLIDGQPAKYDDPIVLIGDKEEGYQCRCILHHECLR